MKYSNKIQTARQKYLKGLPLSDIEQKLINKDLSKKDFIDFISDDTPFIIPDKYSEENTYKLIDEKINQGVPNKSKPLIKYISYAAAILVLTFLSTIIYNNFKQPAMLYVSTSYGEKKEIKLPDGSMVALNSMSSIAYPQEMNGKTREVSLQGEAYFDITKNPNKTFIVKVEDIEVKVLGTKFNIDAYESQEHITTSLFEGIVSVGIHSGHTKKLKPGEQAVFRKKSEKIEIQQIKNMDIETAWRNNELVFDNEQLSNILNALSREYNVTFDIDNKTLEKLHITARFSLNKPLDTALDILGESAEFTYTKQGNKYIITTRK